MSTDNGQRALPAAAAAGYGKEPITASAAGLALLCATLWAGQSVAVKVALKDLPPYMVMCLRIALCCLFVGMWARFTGQRLRISRRQFGLILINSAILYTQIGLFTFGTDMTTSVRSILIVNSFPFFTAIACHYFLPGFPFTWRTISGMFLAFAGLVAVFGDRFAQSSGEFLGDILVLAAAMAIGGKIAFAKALLRTFHPVQLVFWGALCATPLFFILSALYDDIALEAFTPVAIGAVLYQGVAVSGLAVLTWGYLLARHSPMDLNVFRLATPLLGVILGWLILSEEITSNVIVGALLLVTGCYHVTKR